MIDPRFKGVISEPRLIDVEKGQLRFFARATGETDPIYFDEDAAHAAGHRAIPAPPTFTFSLALGAPAIRGDIVNEMGADLRRMLHGEQSFTYHRQIYAGDRISLVTTISDIFTKKGGALEFVVQDTVATNQAGDLCTEMRTVTIIRND